VLVVFIFLRTLRSTLIPAVAVPVSLIGTCAVMYIFGFTLDNLSLMALTIATGFVVDDAIVVMENITRHVEAGMEPIAAALQGAQEIGFTVFSISMSLIAVFIPILMMGGIIGRLFREFAVTLSAAILISMIISLTTTPCMCAHLLRKRPEGKKENIFARTSESAFNGLQGIYRRSLYWVLDNPVLMLIVFLLTVALNVVVILRIPTGIFPQQDTGLVMGMIQGPQDASFPLMNFSVQKLMQIVKADPAIAHANGYTGGGGPGGGASNGGNIFIALKPLGTQCKESPNCAVRQTSAMVVINRLRPKMNALPIASAFCSRVRTCVSAVAEVALNISTPSRATAFPCWRNGARFCLRR
jgi:multidrug efflux pump